MLLLFKSLEWITVKTLQIMFYIWYLFGLWLLPYITIHEGEEKHDPFTYFFRKCEKRFERAEENIEKSDN